MYAVNRVIQASLCMARELSTDCCRSYMKIYPTGDHGDLSFVSCLGGACTMLPVAIGVPVSEVVTHVTSTAKPCERKVVRSRT